MLWKKCWSFLLQIFIILSDIEEFTIWFSDFLHFMVQRWLNRFVYITTNCSCCPLNCLSVPAKIPICSVGTLCPPAPRPPAPQRLPLACQAASRLEPGQACQLPGLALHIYHWVVGHRPWTTWGSAAPPGPTEFSIVSFQIKYSGSCGELCWGWESPCSHSVSGPLWQKSKTQIVKKLKNSNSDKTLKLKLCQNLKKINFYKSQKLKLW